MATLQLTNVVKKYDTLQVIHGVSLDIGHSEFCVFVGPSGCGKSTLLRMIAGLESITEGEMQIDGKRVNEVPASKRGLSMVFQSYALYPHMTVRQNLEFGLENIRLPKDQIRVRVAEATRMLQIEPLLDRKPKALSGGQRQRVAIGRAVVREPKILLFDEPLSNLDAELRVQMRVEIADLHERLGNTMIYVTHDQVEAMTMADKIVVLCGGYIEQVGAPLDLYNRPANRFVAGFIGSPRMNFIEVSVTAIDPDGVAVRDSEGFDYRAAVSGEGLRVGQPATLGVRPEHFTVGHGEGRPLEVEAIEQLGSESYLYCQTASGQKLTAHLAGQTDIRLGDGAQAAFRPEFLHLFAGDGERAQPRLRLGEEEA